MISFPLRALCASIAVALFLGGIAGLIVIGNAWFVLAFVVAAALVVPAMFGGEKPTSDDLPRIDEQLQRFRGAMVICFAAATVLYAIVIAERHTFAQKLLRNIASLGVAFWVIAFVLMFFVAYYRTQRRMALDVE